MPKCNEMLWASSGMGIENMFDMDTKCLGSSGSALTDVTDLIQWCHSGGFRMKEQFCWNNAQKQTVESSLAWSNSIT